MAFEIPAATKDAGVEHAEFFERMSEFLKDAYPETDVAFLDGDLRALQGYAKEIDHDFPSSVQERHLRELIELAIDDNQYPLQDDVCERLRQVVYGNESDLSADVSLE